LSADDENSASSTRARRALVGTGKYAIFKAYGMLVYLGILLLITRSLPAELFPSYALFLVAGTVLVTLADLGCGPAAVRYLVAETDPQRRRVIGATLVWSRFATALLILALLWVVSGWVESDLSRAIRIGGVALASWTMFVAVGDLFRAMDRHGVVAVAHAVYSTAWGASAIGLVILGEGGLAELMAAYAIGYGSALGFLVLRARASLTWTAPSLATFRSLLRFGLPMVSYLVARVAGGLDRYLVGYQSSLSDAGMFQIAGAPTGAIEAAESTWNLAAEPYLYGVPADERAGALRRLVAVVAGASGGAALAASALGPEIVAILAPPSYAPALAALPWLTFAAASRAVAFVVGLGGGVVGRSRAWALGGGTELGLSVPGLLLVLPWGGLAAAGTVRLVASLAGLLVCYQLVRRLWDVRLRLAPVLATFSVAACLAAVFATDAFGVLAPLWVRMIVAAAGLAIGYRYFVRRPFVREKAHHDA